MTTMNKVSIAEAVNTLKEGRLVALPTETVYGLAADISNEKALKKVFTTKKRPLFDPLIVHVAHLKQAEPLAKWSPLARHLAESFWPGPLTIVLPRKESISDLITAGGKTVGLRAPNHKDTLEVIKMLGSPLAAPSANRFGKTSPTSAKHVAQEFKDKIPVLDGGSCKVGIESTVVEVRGKKVSILRPGMIRSQDLEMALQSAFPDVSVVEQSKTVAPGQMKNHYQPDIPLLLMDDILDWSEELLPSVSKKIKIKAGKAQKWKLPADPALAARQLYSDLHHFSQDSENAFILLKIPLLWLENPDWRALMNRLEKAASLWIRHHNGQIQLQDMG